jgi:hypothetical protein
MGRQATGGYPTRNNPATGMPGSPGTDGLRKYHRHREWGQRGDDLSHNLQFKRTRRPKLVAITDNLSAATLPSGDSFAPLLAAGFGEDLRGVSFTPGNKRALPGTVARLAQPGTAWLIRARRSCAVRPKELCRRGGRPL